MSGPRAVPRFPVWILPVSLRDLCSSGCPERPHAPVERRDSRISVVSQSKLLLSVRAMESAATLLGMDLHRSLLHFSALSFFAGFC